VREAVVIAREDQPGEKRLVAYAVTGSPAPAVGALRDHLKTKLPDYMVPAAFVFLEKLPLTANGKIDRRLLPVPEPQRPDLAERYVAPRDVTEKRLAAIWARVLRLERVGIHDNFFELGGDSILTLQIISLARQAGLTFSLRTLFAHQTIAELAAVVEEVGSAQAVDQGPVTGEAPVTPIQRWFLDRQLADPHHYNQALLLSVREPLDPGVLQTALQHLELHHDALRLRLPNAAGFAPVRQYFAPPGTGITLETIDLTDVPDADLGEPITRHATQAEASLDIVKGPLWRALNFHPGANRPSRLLLVIHHLAVDGVSWRILVEDLEGLYSQLRNGARPVLPAKTTSCKVWAERHHEEARHRSFLQEAGQWEALLRKLPPPPRTDHERGANTEASTRTVTKVLDPEATQSLLQRAPSAYNTQINDLLLTALARAISNWSAPMRLG
jgi:hypothetical protein